jgi:hypothetical protein
MARVVIAPALAALALGCAAPSQGNPTTTPPPMRGPVPLQARSMEPMNYATLKGGAIDPTDDDIDTGWYFGGVFGQRVSNLVSMEFETGYGEVEHEVRNSDLFAIPMLLNARVTVPVGFLDLYGGGGLGTTYYDFESSSIGVEGWLFTGDLFAGVETEIRERMTVGVELKYHFTEEMELIDEHLDSFALLATVGWRF